MRFESLHRFHSVRLYCIIGNAKCKYEKFSISQNHLLHRNRLIDESRRQEALLTKPVCAVRTLSERQNSLMMDREQFTSAVLAAEPTLYRVAKTMLRSEHDCADAAQQAILQAWEQLDSLRSTRYFKTWLVRILINECSTILRRQQRLAPYDAAAAEAIAGACG